MESTGETKEGGLKLTWRHQLTRTGGFYLELEYSRGFGAGYEEMKISGVWLSSG
jgi:hypothetical protein